MKPRSTYRTEDWWLKAVAKAGVNSIAFSERDRTAAQVRISQAVLNSELLKARATLRAKLLLKQ